MTASVEAGEEVWRRVRTDFPYLDECVYLNTAAAGISWQGQGREAARFYEDAKQFGYNGMTQWREPAARARASLARLLGVNESEVRFVGSTTEGLNLVVGAMRWRPGDEIVVAADEFPSVRLVCDRAEAMGATVRRVDIADEDERESVLASVISPTTRLVAVSHVHWATGTKLDLVRLSAACREVGARLVVDGVQALGATPVELGGTDAYCASVFKWLLSGFGLAVLVVRDRFATELNPVVRGYNNPPPSTDVQYSHINYPGIFALEASLAYLEAIGWSNVFRRVDLLGEALIQALEAGGVAVVTPRKARAGIVSCRVPNSERARDELAAQRVYVESRDGLLRISPHFYNSTDDVRAVVGALATFL